MLNKWPHVSLESHPASLCGDWGPLPRAWKAPKAPGVCGPQGGNQVIGDVVFDGTNGLEIRGALGWRLQAMASAPGMGLNFHPYPDGVQRAGGSPGG